MNIITPISSTQSQNSYIKADVYWTSAKIKKAVLCVFAALLVGGAVAAVLLAPAPFHLAAIGGVVLALLLLGIACAMIDYDKEGVQKRIREGMKGRDFTEAAGGHNVDRLAKHKVITKEHGELLKELNREEREYWKEWKKETKAAKKNEKALEKARMRYLEKTNALQTQYIQFIEKLA